MYQQPQDNPTLADTFGEFDAGLFVQKATKALQEVAIGVVEHGKKGQLVITVNLSRIGESSSVTCEHSLKYTKPTKNGKLAEDNATSTPFYVNGKGFLTITAQLQQDVFEASGNVTKIGNK